MHKLPNMLIVGAAKCGTTSLASFLGSHPDVYMSRTKELSFFLPPEAQQVTSLADYQKQFRGAEKYSIRGEASVNYLYYEEAPKLIRDTLGVETRIIIVLRDPVDMAYSLWGHNRRLTYESLSFPEALDREDARVHGGDRNLIGWPPNFWYRRRASYARQVQRYLDVFKEDRVKILLFEEMTRDSSRVLTDLCNWLGVQPPDTPALPRTNLAGTTRSKALQQWMDGGSIPKRLIKTLLPGVVRNPLRSLLNQANRVDMPLSKLVEQERADLEQLFTQDVAELSELIGRDLSSFWFRREVV